MNIIEQQENGITVLILDGRLDTVTYSDLETKMNELIGSQTKRIVLDFEKLVYISSSGLRVILNSLKQMSRLNGVIVLAAVNDMIMEVFEMSGFLQILQIGENRQEALEMAAK
ncbi:MAG: STAS domain-containing protein [Bacteroidetes bacterium]|nr:STAS domain-containing protein [Bacteroidota bacterium]MBU1720435.1 STAS domain-containing protein [Bacteroidota bacterium]